MKNFLKKKYSFYIFCSIVFLCMGAILGILENSSIISKRNEKNAASSVPAHNKIVIPNGDGTYTISLDVTGETDDRVEANKANVVVVLDISGSMNFPANASGRTTANGNDTIGRYGEANGDYWRLFYRVTENGRYVYYYEGDGPEKTTRHSTVYRATNVDGSGNPSYSAYNGTRYNFTNNDTRMDQAKVAVKDLIDTLLEQNGTINDMIEVSFLTFSTNAYYVSPSSASANGWTSGTNGTTLKNTVDSVIAAGATNWDEALYNSINLANAKNDNDNTFIVFFSDGKPTQHNGTASVSGSTISHSHNSSTSGGGSTTNTADEYAAYYEARRINQAKYSLYGIFAYGDDAGKTYMKNLISYGNYGDASHSSTVESELLYFSASNQEDIDAAFESIGTSITSKVGFDKVSIDDGTTSAVEATTGEIFDLLNVDTSSYEYWLSVPVTRDGDNYKASMNDKEITISSDLRTITWIDPDDESTKTVTVNKGEIVTKDAQGNDLDKPLFKFSWESSNDLYGKNPPAASFNGSSVNWDLSGLGSLLNGVTYTITFNVWPSQTTYDLISDLDNGIISYSDVDENVKEYLLEDGNGGYVLLTNTGATLTYTDTRTDDGVQTAQYDPPNGVATDDSKMSVKKLWLNQLDDRDAREIDLYITKDGNFYGKHGIDPETGEDVILPITMKESKNWEEEVYISTGLMTVTEVDGQKVARVRETGHDYTFKEVGYITYYWELEVETVRPMLVNGTLTTLVKVEENAPQFAEGQNVLVKDGVTYYKIPDHNNVMSVYYARNVNTALMIAKNIRRSNLNLTKITTGEAPKDEMFTFNIKVTDFNGDDIWFSIYEGNSIVKNITTTAEAEEGDTGYYFFSSGGTVTVEMKAGWNLRILNLPTGSTYEFEETTVTDGSNGFVFGQIESGATLNVVVDSVPEGAVSNGNGTYTYEGRLYRPITDSTGAVTGYTYDSSSTNTTVNGKKVTGTIYLGNSSFVAQYINEYMFTSVTVSKAWEDNDDQDGMRPDSVKVKLLADGTQVGEIVTLNDDNSWTYTWSELQKFDNNREIKYTVEEVKDDVITGTDGAGTYKIDYEGTLSLHFKTSTLRDTDVVTAKILANGEETGKTITLNRANNWETTVTGLDYLDENDQVITYTVVETSSLSANIKMYTGDKEIEVTNTHTPELTTVSVSKTWDDNNDQDGKRPTSVKVQLYMGNEKLGQEVVLDSSNSWAYTWTDLEKYSDGEIISYTVEEIKTSVITGTDGAGTYSISIDGDQTEGYVVTNKHTPEKTTVSVSKTWDDNNDQDGIRPDEVEVQLYAGNSESGEPVKLDSTNSWAYTWTGLDKYSEGVEIVYTVDEIKTEVITGTDGAGTYSISVSGSQASGYVVTNKHTPEKTTVSVSKTWDDNNNQDGIRPTSVEVQLYSGETALGEKVQLSSSNSWSYEWTGLEKYSQGELVEYTVQEITTDVITGTDGAGTYSIAISGDKTEGYVVTNKHTPEKTTVTVVKTWDDTSNQDGIRPDEVEVQLYANNSESGEPVKLDSNNSWTYTWTGLEKYNNGVAISYTVDEIKTDVITGTDGAGTYSYSVAGSQVTGYMVTNKHTPEKTTVSVSKTWDDNDDQDGIRPTSVKVQLYMGNEKLGEEVVLDSSNSWAYTWTGLEKYNDGVVIKYTVDEIKTDVITGTDGAGTYSISISGSQTSGYVVTNKHTPEVKAIEGLKTWDDADNQDGKRPASLIINLLADGEIYRSLTTDALKEWKYSFTGLPVYKDGAVIVYTIDEASVPEGYEKTISGNNITNKHVPETTSVDGVKTWDDNNDQDGKRPESLTINLLADGEVYKTTTTNATLEWKYSFTDLPVYKAGVKIVYTIDEATVPTGYEKTISGNNITNKHVPETTSVDGVKTWDDNNNQDGKRPESITVDLLADGEVYKTTTTNATLEWKYSFTDLPVYKAGVKIVYTIQEKEVSLYTTTYDGNNITNQYTPETTSISGVKTWDDNNDQDGKRPDKLTINLLADGEVYRSIEIDAEGEWKYSFTGLPVYKDGVKIVYTVDEASVPEGYEKTINGNNITNKHVPETTSISGTKTWDDNNNQDGKRPTTLTINLLANGEIYRAVTTDALKEWKYSFTNLPVYKDGVKIVYTIDEATVPAGYEKVITGYDIENKHDVEKITINGVKTWDDNNNQDGKRPESLTINLLADGEVYKTVTTNASLEWKYSFTDLPVYKNGSKIVYTVDEASVPEGYTKTISGYDVTNKHVPETTSIEGKKIWDDANNQDGKRPESITVKLLADGEVYDTIVVDQSSNWKYSFTDLPVYKNGTKIVYKIDEVSVPNYRTTYENYDITNRYTPEVTSVTVKKVWDDDNNRDNIRPQDITFNLFVNGELKLSKTVTARDNWTYTFNNLPVYSSGEKLVYTVTEDEVSKYITTIQGNQDTGFTVTNSYKPETISINGNKVWDDADNQDGKRPNSIKVTLFGDDKEVTSKTVTAEDEWKFEFNNLPKYDQGSEIVYSIKETAIEGYTSTITGSFKEGYTITNSHTPIKISLNGEKIWVDSNDKDGLRPESIKVSLLADGEVVKTITVSEEDEWKYSFPDLDKYKNQKEIKYTIEEEPVDKYTTTYDGYSIINTHTPKDVTIEGIKTWDDEANVYGRPESIKVNLTGKIGDEVVVSETKTVTAEDEWKYSFTNLPEYKNGIYIVYSITEDNVLDYSTSYDGYNIKNTYTPATVDFRGEKIWNDNDDQDGKRQESITINLLADGEVVDSVEVSSETEWKFEFTGKIKYANGREIKYTIEEVEVEGYEDEIETVTDSETGEISFVVSNTHTPEEVSFKVTKEWQDYNDNDGIRPDNLTVYLYKTVKGERSLVKEQIIDESNNWTYTFSNLPKYEKGNLITYDITEEEVKGYVPTVNDPVVVDDNNITQLLINTHEPETIKINGTKTWDDDDDRDGLRPDTIIVYLYADGELVGTKEVSADTEWYYEFTDLRVFKDKQKINYEIVEEEVENYTSEVVDYNITNTHEPEKISISGTKTWDDNNNQDGIRPNSIVINLYANGVLKEKKTVTKDDNWAYSFTDLNKYESGVAIVYTIDEDPVSGYKATYNGFNVTNTHTPSKISLTLDKTWNDNDNEDEIRPDEVVVHIYQNGTYFRTVTITLEDEWHLVVSNLDEYKNGSKITYTVEEEYIVGYHAVYNVNDNAIEIVNVHTPEKGDTDIIDPPHTGIDTVPDTSIPLMNIVIYDDRKKYRMS